ncbi:MAG: hypothetical protein D6736_13965 [Nitrospinota bacterium]|nr:MAG: hypothetical protein D6736_13965 [Nitrospinota bacterium]
MEFEIIDDEGTWFPPSPAPAFNEEQKGSKPGIRLGDILLRYNLITPEQLQEALEQGKKQHTRLGETLVSMGVLTQDQINWALAHFLGIPYVELTREMINPSLVRTIPEKVLRQYLLIPLVQLEDELTIAMADPTNKQAIADIENITGHKVQVSLASATAIQRFLDEVFCPPTVRKEKEGFDPREVEGEEAGSSEEFSSLRFLDHHLLQASQEGAEEIHLDPGPDTIRIRYRVRGVLIEKGEESKTLHYPILSRLKILANLPLEEGLFQQAPLQISSAGTLFSLHLSILPTTQGEAIVLKLLQESPPLPLADTGLSPEMIGRICQLIQRECGLLLVAGRGRGGNVSVLYAILQEIPHLARKKIITIEQHTRFQCSAANQIGLDCFPDLSYATALEHALAQHPDILLLDDINRLDRASLTQLLYAALSDTLVLGATEFHDPFSTLECLRQHIESPILLSATLLGILTRTSLQQLCSHCKQVAPPVEWLPALSPLSPFLFTPSEAMFYQAEGCPACQQTGYQGSITLYELLEITPPLRDGLQKNVPSDTLNNLLQAAGAGRLRRQAWQMALEGKVSLHEVLNKTS